MEIDPETLTFIRHPVRDVSVPKSHDDMKAILRTIRQARHCGEILYLHCWGGRGRTGTVAGCLIGDLFMQEGDAALTYLARRWRICAKSEYSDSPETDEQRAYVANWSSGREPYAARVRAAILGAAVGDALGVPVEFQSRSKRKADPVTGMREFGTHHQPAGTWSDDTSMILATMEGLLEAGRYDPDAVMRQFGAWVEDAQHTPHGEVFDIGIATRSAIQRYRSGIPALDCGGTGEMSNGNGSLMRILPIALAFADDPTLIKRASQMSALTHAHERSRLCCAFYCLVVSELLHGGTIFEATKFAWTILNRRWKFSASERARFEALRPDRLFAREEAGVGSSGHVIDTLEAALWVNARHESYAETVLHGVNLGDVTDTTGCVACGLAGLIHGEGGIPGEWLEVLVKREGLIDLAARFAAFCESVRCVQTADKSES